MVTRAEASYAIDALRYMAALNGDTSWTDAKSARLVQQVTSGEISLGRVEANINARLGILGNPQETNDFIQGMRGGSGGSPRPQTPKPPTETPEERAAREAMERQRDASAAEAARRSRDIFATIRGVLAQYGIEGGEVDALLTQLIQDDAGEAEIMLKLRDTQAWKTRFAGNELRRQRGMNVLDPRTYLQWEQDARQLMREANMPAGFMDEASDFAEMIGKDVSINELSRRITNGYVKVAQAPIEIRQAFTDYFGANGDSALAALFLNFEKGADVLEKHVAAAEFGGTARRFGFKDNQVIAQRAAELGVTREQAEQGMGQLIDINHLFQETVTEGGEDLVAEREGFGSVFGFTPRDAETIRRRREQRVGSMSGSTSGAMITREGVLGFRTASTNE